MTHIMREVERTGSNLNKKQIVEPTTVIETPPIRVVGLVGYVETPRGLRALTTVWAQNLGDEFKRRFYRNWYKSKKKCFTKAVEKVANGGNAQLLERMKKYCTVIRVIVHTQTGLLNNQTKKAHVMEIQINGGSIAEKVDFGVGLFEQEVKVDQVFSDFDVCDVIGVTKGHGVTGVVKRFGVKRLPRKTHRGLRRVGCIGSWHPANVQWTVARTGQLGFHHRTEMNKRIYRVGKAPSEENKANAATDYDLTEKNITPMGGFVRYGEVNNDFVMIKGCCIGLRKRQLILRHPIYTRTKNKLTEPVHLNFIDTSSKLGHGRFQTAAEKQKFFVSSKKYNAEKAE
jgi:large subunit ribosomal protein L3e